MIEGFGRACKHREDAEDDLDGDSTKSAARLITRSGEAAAAHRLPNWDL